jgi:hypothetical protein
VLAAALSASGFAAQLDNAPKPLNELTLAGLRPGRDPLTNAFKHYKQKYLVSKTSAESKEWRDTCTGRSLVLAVDPHSVIQEITVSLLVPRDGNCDNRRFEFLNLDDWVTGKGLRLGDSRNHVVELYGEPNSSEPVVRQDADLELLRFDFEGIGPDAPQEMQIYCQRDSGRVVEIALFASSHIGMKRAQSE